MSTAISVTYQTARPGNDPHSYSVDVGTSADRPFPLRQIGPVFNGTVTYRGVYELRRDALQAALDAIGTPCVLVEHADPMAGSIVHSVRRVSYVTKGHNRAIARRLKAGDWIASA